MINLLVTTILCLAVSIIISGVAVGMGSNSGWAAAGKEAAEACVLIIIAYVIFTAVYKTGVGYEGIPFADCLENYESLKDLMTNDPSTFVFNVAELITVTLIMSLLAKVIPSSTGGKGLIGKILFKILLVMLALAANHYVVHWAKGNPIWTILINFLMYFFGFSVVVLTPAMIITYIITTITGLKDTTPFVKFLASSLPNSAVGTAIKTAFSSSITFLGVLFMTDAYFGTLGNAVTPIVQILFESGPIIIMLGGIMLMLSTIFH